MTVGTEFLVDRRPYEGSVDRHTRTDPERVMSRTYGGGRRGRKQLVVSPSSVRLSWIGALRAAWETDAWWTRQPSGDDWSENPASSGMHRASYNTRALHRDVGYRFG